MSGTAAPEDPDELRGRLRESWERAASGWGRRANAVRDWGMPVSAWMIEHARLQPGQRVLELAAGPGDLGFMASEQIAPGGVLICSDGSEAMLEAARRRAAQQDIKAVEFSRLELEWIDLPTADVDVILCRWGVMLTVDPEACLRECRRVLRPSGRMVLAVWDEPARNPWATLPTRALVELDLVPAPPPEGGPGPFALSAPGMLQDLLQAAGFAPLELESVAVRRSFENAAGYLAETLDLSPGFGAAWSGLDEAARERVRERMTELADPWRDPQGGMLLPGSALVATAEA